MDQVSNETSEKTSRPNEESAHCLEKDKVESSQNTNLDALLDDALLDFNRTIPPKRNTEDSSNNATNMGNNSAWTEEFIAAATKNFETTMRNVISQQKETSENDLNSDGSVDFGAMSAEFSKFVEAAAQAATESSTDKDFTQCLTDTMKQMAKNTDEAQAVPTAEELQKMFESFSLGENDVNQVNGLFPMMQTVLENILSKDVLYPPLKELVGKYPEWLADKRSSLPETDYTRYNKQYDIMKQVVDIFEQESGFESVEEKTKNGERVMLLMQELQELGQPPLELVGDYESFQAEKDGSSLMPDLSSLLGSAGFPSFGGSEATNSADQMDSQPGSSAAGETNQECCMM